MIEGQSKRVVWIGERKEQEMGRDPNGIIGKGKNDIVYLVDQGQ